MRHHLPSLIRALAGALAAWALIVGVSGGVDLRPFGIPFRSTNFDRPLLAALLLVVVYVGFYRARAAADAEWLSVRAAPLASAVVRHSSACALLLSIIAVALGMLFGVHVAGGSDSWGYISQVRLWRALDLVTEQPIATQVPWPDADWTFAPLGYRPALTPGAIVPVYAPGLPMLMTAGTLLTGSCGPYLVVPLLGGVLVWLTFVVGRAIWSRETGLIAAALLVTSPTFLFMLMNPMSDVPAAAFCLAAFAAALTRWRTRAFWTGAAISAAILVRPNLVPLGLVFFAIVLARREDRTWWNVARFAVGGLPLVLVVAAVNAQLYGAPWRAGYGALDQFYAWRHALPNIVQYNAWLAETETPFIALLFVPLALMRRVDAHRRVAIACAASIAAAVWMSYLFYAPYDAWWYLRFLLPAVPIMLLLATIGAAWLIERLIDPHKALAAILVILVLVFGARLTTIREHGVLSLWRGGIVYLSAAEYIRNELPRNAVILTIQHSGSVRYYADRLTLRWDLLSPEWWPPALAVLVTSGYQPYLLVSSFEEGELRRHFSMSPAIDAPGALVAEMTVPESIRLYDPLRSAAGPPDVIPAVMPCVCGSER